MYKTKVQELCHQKRWSLPRYSTMKDGADHDPRFKSSVSVNGLSFHSSVSCKSSKESQNDAAKLAFLHFTSPPPPPSELHYCFFTKALRVETVLDPEFIIFFTEKLLYTICDALFDQGLQQKMSRLLIKDWKWMKSLKWLISIIPIVQVP